MLLNMARCCFGSLPNDAAQRIRTANVSRLEGWALNFVDATTLEDVFRD